MATISVQVDLNVPRKTFIYDMGAENFCCSVCGDTERYQIFNLKATRIARPNFETAATAFIASHKNCLLKKREKRAVARATGPCRQDYRKADGSGPHECGKTIGHSGPCGS